jgi:hypothetical protein
MTTSPQHDDPSHLSDLKDVVHGDNSVFELIRAGQSIASDSFNRTLST